MCRNAFIHTHNFLSCWCITFICTFSLCLLYLFSAMDVSFPQNKTRFQHLLLKCQSTATAMIESSHWGFPMAQWWCGQKIWANWDCPKYMGLVLPPLPELTHFTVTKTEDLRGFFSKCKMNFMLSWPFQKSATGRADVGHTLSVTSPWHKLPSCKALQTVIRSYDLSVQTRSCSLSEPISQTQKPSNFPGRESLHEDGFL